MQGNNEMRLNGATMNRIVQEWIDREIKSKPKVSYVTTLGREGIFVVKLTDQPDHKEAA